MTPEGIQRFKRFEGLRLKTYYCPSGRLTIGYGHTNGVKQNDVITEEIANALLEADLAVALSDIKKYVPRFDKIDQVRQEALLHFSFGLGIPGLETFKGGQTLHYINSEAWISAGESMKRTKWAKDVGRIRAEEVVHAIKYGMWPEDQRVL